MKNQQNKIVEVYFGNKNELQMILDSTGQTYNDYQSVENEACVTAFLSDYFKALKKDLLDIERQVLVRRLDIQGNENMTREEVGTELNIPVHHVEVFEKVALKKLSRNKTLKSYNENR